MKFRLPRPDEHTTIVGRTGTGKTQFGLDLLSQTEYLKRFPWIITDYKGDELIARLRNARDISIGEMPREPGLYVVHPRPEIDDDAVDAHMMRIWERGRTGFIADEAYMLPQNLAYRSLLTQGRSKRIPVITLSQRPVKVDRFAFSEASHLIVFDLNDRRDQKTVSEIVPPGFYEWIPPEFSGVARGNKLPRFHARWYNVKDDTSFVVTPARSADEIADSIDGQLKPKRRFL